MSVEVDAGNMFTMRSVLQSLHRQHGVGSVMVEGGVRLIQNMIREHTQAERSGNPAAEDGELVDTVVVTVSTKAIGGKRIEGVTYNLGSNPETFRLGACVFSPIPARVHVPLPAPASRWRKCPRSLGRVIELLKFSRRARLLHRPAPVVRACPAH